MKRTGFFPSPHPSWVKDSETNKKEGLEIIAALAATEKAQIPDLKRGDVKYVRGLVSANKNV